jgi:pseudouridine synthase
LQGDYKVSIESSVRLNKYISDSGYCSRREADKLIDSNRVKVNGRRPELGTRVYADDRVTVDGQEVLGSAPSKSDRVYIVYNKPIGITCTTERSVKGNIIDAIDHDQRIFPIGRLDKPSEGLILLTSDGDIVNKILRAENNHEKEYVVTVNKSLGSDFASKMSGGIPILGTMTKPCRVSVLGRTAFKITLTQGLNRQIRRMCEYLGYEVVQLARVRIMNVSLGKLKPGQWRNLSPQEIEELNAAIDHSHSEPTGRQASPKKQSEKPPAKTGTKTRGAKTNGAKTKGAKTKGAKKTGGKSTRTGRAGVKKSPAARPSRRRK